MDAPNTPENQRSLRRMLHLFLVHVKISLLTCHEINGFRLIRDMAMNFLAKPCKKYC